MRHPQLLYLAAQCSSVHHLHQIHAQILRRNLPAPFAAAVLAKLLVFTAISPLRNLPLASLLFSFHLPLLSTSSPNLAFFYNTLIRAHSSSPSPSNSLCLFNSMRLRGVYPDHFTFTFLIKARSRCSDPSIFDVHALALKLGCAGLLSNNLHVCNSLINLYASCGRVGDARKVFDEMLSPDVVSWTGLVSALLSAGDLDGAREVFDGMPERDLVSWTGMISGYLRSGRVRDALGLFWMMPLLPDEVTMVGVVSACAKLGDLETGKRVYCYVVENGFGWMVSLCNALIDMYSKCGCLLKARDVFDGIRCKDVISWNTMIAAYGAHGCADEAAVLFCRMVECDVVRPDSFTLLAVLSAYTNKGMVEEGRRLFEGLREGKYIEVEASVEHYGCMVDLLGRAGKLEEAYWLIEQMPIPSNEVIWGALLGACRIHGHVEMAELAVAKLMELKPDEGGYYVLLSDIYAAAGRLQESSEVRQRMKDKGVKKNRGSSSWAGAQNIDTPC